VRQAIQLRSSWCRSSRSVAGSCAKTYGLSVDSVRTKECGAHDESNELSGELSTRGSPLRSDIEAPFLAGS